MQNKRLEKYSQKGVGGGNSWDISNCPPSLFAKFDEMDYFANQKMLPVDDRSLFTVDGSQYVDKERTTG